MTKPVSKFFQHLCLALLAGFILSSCGGGGGGGGSSAPAQESNQINGITVPTDPGAAANTTIVGVDTNGNGIRDEIDRFIATKYGANPKQVAAAQLSARAHQRILQTDASNANASFDAMTNSVDAGICAGELFEANGITSPVRELNEIFLRSINTPERIAQKKAVATKAGQFTRSVASVVCP